MVDFPDREIPTGTRSDIYPGVGAEPFIQQGDIYWKGPPIAVAGGERRSTVKIYDMGKDAERDVIVSWLRFFAVCLPSDQCKALETAADGVASNAHRISPPKPDENAKATSAVVMTVHGEVPLRDYLAEHGWAFVYDDIMGRGGAR